MHSSTAEEIDKLPTGKSSTAARPSAVLINFWLDATLFVAIVVLVWTMAIMQFAFPAPTAAAGWSLWGLTYDQWHNVQFTAMCIAGALTVEHLVLHWNWVCTVMATRILRRKRPDEANQAVYGVALFIGVLVLLNASLVAAMLFVKQP